MSPRYQPTAADLLDDEPPAPADWPALPATHYYGYARPHNAGDLAHIWRTSDRVVHTALCKAQTKQPPLTTTPRPGAVLCARCRAQAPDAPPARPLEEQPTIAALDQAIRDGEAPLVTVEQLDALPARPTLLPFTLQERARRYVAARRRSGEALLDAVAELASARAEARHGEWSIFLQSVGLDESAARAQLRIHELARTDETYAERIRSGFLTEATARELLSLPEEARAEVLSRPEPPTRQEIREVKEPKREPAPVLPALDRELALVLADLAPRAAALGLALAKTEAGEYLLSGPSLEPAIFMGRKGLDDYLTARERERAKAPIVDGPEAALLAAGWRPHQSDPLIWEAPGRDARGAVTVLEFADASELATAAAILAAEPTISGDELAERVTIAHAEPAQPAADFRNTCRTCGKPFTNGQFAGQCGPCYRGEARPVEPEPAQAEPADGIPIDVRVLAEAHGLILQSAAPEDGFYLYWPWEKDQTDAFIPFNAEWARDWMMSDGPAGSERIPDCLATRAIAAGWFIVGAHADGRLIVQPASDETYTVTEEISVADLEARIAPAPAPYVTIAPTPHTSVTVMPAPGETVAAAIEANRDNPAWQAGDDPIDALVWGLVEVANSDSPDGRPQRRDLPRALHLARQLVALLEIAHAAPIDFSTAVVYRRVAELERAPAPLGLTALRDLDDVTASLEDLAGTFDDASYEDLAARLTAVRGRGKAAA